MPGLCIGDAPSCSSQAPPSIALLIPSPTTCGFHQPFRPQNQEFLTILRPAGEEALGNLKSRDRWTWLQNLALLGCPSRLYQPGGGCCLRAFWQEEMRPWTWCKAGPGRRRVVRGAKCQFELVEHYCS